LPSVKIVSSALPSIGPMKSGSVSVKPSNLRRLRTGPKAGQATLWACAVGGDKAVARISNAIVDARMDVSKRI
jgi:hypothetical protein